MTQDTTLWLLSTLFWTCIMSFYSMQEMALISFNRLRLEHSVRKGSLRARWIKQLLDNPTALFGTTLIGVNIALVISSESLRRLFASLDINPNYSIFVSAPYMIILGELVPMFAARLYPEHMARIGIPLLYASSTIFAPLARLFDALFQTIRKFFFPKNVPIDPMHLQRDELQNLVQEGAVEYFDIASGQLESTVSKMFQLKDKEISSIMTPIDQYLCLQSTYLCSAARERFLDQKLDSALVVNRQKKIIGYCTAWDLVFANSTASIGSIIRTVTYVGEKTKIIDTLFRLKKEHTEGAFVIGAGGIVAGFIALDNVLMQVACDDYSKSLLHLEITLPGNMKISEFSTTYRLTLPKTQAKTFRALIDELLGHKPCVNESVRFGTIEIIVKEVTIRGAKKIVVRTVA